MQTTEFQQRLAGVDTVLRRWLPESAPRAIVQIIHGMAEHSARYARLAQALAAEHYAVYAHDLPGHGPRAELRGHFGDRNGWRVAVASIRAAQNVARREHPGVPVFLLGHSLGSFLLQHYVTDHGGDLAGAVFSATTGDLGRLRAVGAALVRAEAVLRGRRHPSAVGEALSFRNYNRAFRPARTAFDWLSRDPAEVDHYVADPLCGFRCTTGLWLDVLDAGAHLADPARLRRIPKSLPVLMIAGSDDPVSNGGKGPAALARLYRRSGVKDVQVIVYPGGRHELFNDSCREQVTAELVGWLGNHAPAPVS